MARKQYRYFGEAAWQAMSGNAILAIQNMLGSGKKILVHSFEVHSRTRGVASWATAYANLRLARNTVNGGTPVPLNPWDTGATLPSGIEVRKFSSSSPVASQVFRRTTWYKNFNLAGVRLPQRWGTSVRIGGIRDGWFEAVQLDNGTTGIVVRPGQAVSLTVESCNASQLFLVSGKFVLHGTPKHTFNFSTVAWAVSGGVDLISFVNNSASDVITIKSIALQEAGTLDTPYLQLVPVGRIDPQSQSDQLMRLTPVAMDTSYGSLSESEAKLVANAPMLPYGVPQQYIADGSTGSPKGYNYLHTKDFIGPRFFTMFPEYTSQNSGIQADDRCKPFAGRKNNLLTPGAPIVLREGEALAVVSGAETAITTSAVGTSGWSLFDFGITFSVEPTSIPEISATGIVPGSRYRVERTSDGSTVTTGVVGGSGTFSYTYSAFNGTETMKLKVRNASGTPAYKPYEVTFALTSAGITIPVAQELDE